ncbi:MAG TPA: FAD:protein FMN transferase [Steroidobacter sp.]|nr:FAD:protein FMN transferase [Steroidobacteraceae bacterium]HLS82391.1 FAD:protein FMN transferase [Steroidobacter sp.]
MTRFLFFLSALLCAACAAHAEWFERVEDGVMGTRIVVELWADSPEAGQAAIDAALQEMRRIDAAMSTYKADSELSLLNQLAATQPVRVSQELFDLLAESLHYSRITNGAFDVTYASVGYLYDYRRGVRPDDETLRAALPGIDYRHVLLNPADRTVRYARPGVRVDLGGIGKGHAVDRAIAALQARGVERALVTAGGDSRIIGDRFGKPWVVGIRHPDRKEEVIARIPLEDAALSTSGDYERYFDEGGVRHHHILDPHTGRAASKVRSATIIGPTATQTDGLSKTAFVLGPEPALEIYNRLDDVDAILVTPQGRVLYTKGLEAPDSGAR